MIGRAGELSRGSAAIPEERGGVLRIGWDGGVMVTIDDPHALAAEEVLKALGSDGVNGLSVAEAARRLAEIGANELPETRPVGALVVLGRQFASPLIYLLLVAALIAGAMGHRGDAGVILVVVVVNALLGAYQERRAARSMAALRKLSVLMVRVVRGGEEVAIEASGLVPGDVVVLAAGDAVGADGRLIEVVAMEAAEAALTGESVPVVKDAGAVPVGTLMADRRGMVYAATHVAAGRGRAVVTATGERTEAGRIADLTMTAREPKTPLEARLEGFGRMLAGASLGLFGLVIAGGLARGMPFPEILMVAISQMVSVVPEGLPVAMTVALAVGMQRMARRGAVVRRLSAVETLGSVSVICTDKTGTLTRNEMTVTALRLPGGREVAVSGGGYAPEGELTEGGVRVAGGDAAVRRMIEALVLCNDARLEGPEGEETAWRIAGDPTEAAMLTLAKKAGLDPEEVRAANVRVAELPFDAASRLMAVQCGSGGSGRILIKGAPETVLALCGLVAGGDGADGELGEEERAAMQAAAEAMSGEALRVLAAAEIPGRELDAGGGYAALAGHGVWLGLVGEMDPPREGVKEAVAECRGAGIRTVMVTGDHKATGLAVARLLGIARDGDLAVDGAELERMSEGKLRGELERISVFARVHPAQKLRIVEAWQAKGGVVAVTGDGVNDAPALARADAGVAMGITGTEVAKSAAGIVITDDNFPTMVGAVAGGRLVYRNLKKVILYLFTTSVDEVVLLLLALMCGLPLPLLAVQILWINLVTEGVLTVNLVMEESHGREMDRPPVGRDEPLVTREMLKRMIGMVGASVVSVFGYYVWRLGSGVSLELVRSETFTVLAVSQWFNVLNCRSATDSAFDGTMVRNRWLLAGLVMGNLLQAAVIYGAPMNRLFHTVPIDFRHFVLIGLVASPVLWVEEVRKWLVRRRGRVGGV